MNVAPAIFIAGTRDEVFTSDQLDLSGPPMTARDASEAKEVALLPPPIPTRLLQNVPSNGNGDEIFSASSGLDIDAKKRIRRKGKKVAQYLFLV